MQETALRGAGVERLFTERAAGGRWDRPELHRLLDQLRPRDVVVVWKLDRLSRSLQDLLHLMERIAQAGVREAIPLWGFLPTPPQGYTKHRLLILMADLSRRQC